MSKIATYSLADTPLQLSDRLIGTEAPRPTPSATPLATKNFSLGELLNLFSGNFPAATLQAVLNAGNTATQNITLVGTIDTTLIRPDNIEDTSGSQGLPFQFLSKGASSINWGYLPVDNLQAVLNAGNTATQSITLVGNITSTRIIPGNIQDDTTGIGTTGQFLSKTALGIRWVNAPTSTTPGLGDVLSVGNTAINNINLTGNVTATSFIKTGGTNLQYLMADGSVTTGGGIQTLQQVTDAGNTTTNSIIVAGITSGNLYSDGYNFGISDNYDTNYNLFYTPYVGLQITDTINSIYLYQDASIGFQTATGFGNLRSDLVTGSWSWQLPDASGTIALTSDIGTWGALNYPTWTAGTPFVKMTGVGTFALDSTTYYPYPTGTISEYIRGDGTLATLPSVTTPTLQQVTTAGNTTTDTIYLQTGLSPLSVILDNGYISLFNNITNRQITISTSNDISFSDGGGNNLYLKSPATITATNTQTLQNASGTVALLSDIPAAGVTSVGLTMPSAFSVTNSPITSSGDIAVTGAGSVSQYVRGDGTLANFPNSTGGGSSVNYYLNGSVSQGTFGGTTYYQMSKTPILGAGTNFTRTNGAGNGYIASFITDAGDPSQLNIPGGNWNVEFYFNASSGGGSPSFYAELYKVDVSNNFTFIASDSLNPEGITNGTTVDQYFTSIPVPQTTLLITDRLAVRIFVNTGGRTITLHTENGNLSEVLTTFTTGLTALNGLTDQVQFFDVGTTGTDFNISSVTDTHTFNLPTASATNRGALSSTDWSTFNAKADLGLVQAMTQGLQNIF
jgi:hypothetical protein